MVSLSVSHSVTFLNFLVSPEISVHLDILHKTRLKFSINHLFSWPLNCLCPTRPVLVSDSVAAVVAGGVSRPHERPAAAAQTTTANFTINLRVFHSPSSSSLPLLLLVRGQGASKLNSDSLRCGSLGLGLSANVVIIVIAKINH